MGQGFVEHARELGLELPPEVEEPDAEVTPEVMIKVFRQVAGRYFPNLAPESTAVGRSASS